MPVILREADDRAVLELALIENLQRENLNPMEEAQGYAQLVQQFQLKQEEVATKVGKSRAAVTNALRLLKLPEPVREHLRDGRLSVWQERLRDRRGFGSVTFCPYTGVLFAATGHRNTPILEHRLINSIGYDLHRRRIW